jgi:hypothetical protein
MQGKDLPVTRYSRMIRGIRTYCPAWSHLRLDQTSGVTGVFRPASHARNLAASGIRTSRGNPPFDLGVV